ncbi:hypothetical protein PAMP_016431 [Pampus punctatissimus]
MKPPVTNVIVAGWLCVLLAVASKASETLNKKVGDEVVLKPGCNFTTNILWKVDQNMAVSWDGTETEYYRQFKVRGKLDNSSGALTITGLVKEDSGRYTPEINNNICKTTELIVMFPVPTPTVSVSCKEKTTCTLTCDGDTTNAEPVKYEWMFDNLNKDLPKTHVVTKENISNISEFRCKIKNSVSEKSSPPVTNPTKGGLKINTGLTVFISLMTAVVLLVLIHKWKAGSWFFQKTSMPWEADFWKKDSQATGAAESNGTTACPEKRQAVDEETPMT